MKWARRVPVIAGTGSNSTTEAIRLTKHAKEAGADAALLITPYYNKPTQKGLVEHYKAVASACDIPQILYNVPGRTGVNMSSATVVELSKIDNIVGIKEASGDLVKCSQIVRDTADDFCVLSGEDALNYPILCCGGVGAISVTANVLPDRVSALCAAWDALDIPTAKKIHLELLEINQTLFIETNPIPVKTALAMMGHDERGIQTAPVPYGGAPIRRYLPRCSSATDASVNPWRFPMIKTGVVGFGGRMGSLIARTILDNPDFALEGALEDKAHPVIGRDVGEALGYPKAGIRVASGIEDAFAACDCIIDFTFPEVTLKVCSYAARKQQGHGDRVYRVY